MKACSVCHATKPLTDFHRRRRSADGLEARCKPCRLQQASRYRSADPEAYRQSRRKAELKVKFGITPEDYDRMLEEQGGRCAICGTDKPRGRGRLHVDHNHETGQVRGLLCNGCNVGIGMLNDSPDVLRRAVDYLEERSFVGADK